MVGEDVIYELAARLGSIVTFDRHGWVVWMDDFEDGLGKCTIVDSGTGSASARATDYVRSGGYSLKLTAGSDGLRKNMVYYFLPYPMVGKWGFEFSWRPDGNLDYLDFRAQVVDGANSHVLVVRYSYTDETLSYYDADGAWVVFATDVDLVPSDPHFNSWKLVVDFAETEYVRLLVNETSYDLSGYGGWEGVDVSALQMTVLLTHVGTSGKNAVLYVDDVIITQNEP